MAALSPSRSEALRGLVGRSSLECIDIVRVHAERGDMLEIGRGLARPSTEAGLVPRIELSFPPRQEGGTMTFMVNLLADLHEDFIAARSGANSRRLGLFAVSARMLYRLEGEQPSEALTHQFGRELAVHHAWPFLRERVNTLAQGIGLAPALLPLRRIDAGLVD
ncbi:MAG: hypothetical protein R3F60_02115 [bacterium]